MNLDNLTPDQLSAVEKVVAEFNKVNEPMVSNGLINVSFIMENEVKRIADIERVKASNEAFQLLLVDTIKADCAKINEDLNKLGLKAFHYKRFGYYSQSLVISTIDLEETNVSRNNSDKFQQIDYKALHTRDNRSSTEEYNGFQIETYSVMGNSLKFDNFEECIKSKRIQDKIAAMYKNFGKK